jgi:hypothetical protein
MTSKINNSVDAATNGAKPVTFEAADDLGAFELASRWADRLSWPMPLNRSASDDLAELACMSALAQWLVRWKPIQLHRAVLAGARGSRWPAADPVHRAKLTRHERVAAYLRRAASLDRGGEVVAG